MRPLSYYNLGKLIELYFLILLFCYLFRIHCPIIAYFSYYKIINEKKVRF